MPSVAFQWSQMKYKSIHVLFTILNIYLSMCFDYCASEALFQIEPEINRNEQEKS